MKKLLTTGFMLAALSFAPAMAQQPQPFNPDPAAVRAGTYALDASHGKITWTVSHLGLSRYTGQLTDVQAELRLDPKAPDQGSLRVTIPLEKGGTLDADLDKHLRAADFFDTAKHPEARFVSTRIERTGDRTARVTGDLTLRGVTRPVAFEARFNTAGVHPVTKRYTLGFDGTATLKRSEFGMGYMVPAVSDEVALHLAGEFQIVE
ncbi:YceI family protein [Pseudoroseomonas globiformis]|uniref:YceI family protein n=1 Tax=Teichococcus globiformis TaxID=2307229 RepID=A0ABV7G657_9PROT